MRVINVGEFVSTLFLWLRLGASLTVLVILIAKLVNVVQETNQTTDTQSYQPNLEIKL